ncbi:Transcription factor CPC [Platanthera guangdongensis]|uniref:Transcription factor CPC n=1 Tax=Platanthera guangdongensis TaxID=2320717 RepID=A0ABR2MZ56_9ASPA
MHIAVSLSSSLAGSGVKAHDPRKSDTVHSSHKVQEKIFRFGSKYPPSKEMGRYISCQVSQMEFSEAEIDLIARIYKLIGKRWSLIAGRIPGRTAEEIEKYCTPKFEKSG